MAAKPASPSKLEIDLIEVGELAVCCYIFHRQGEKKCGIIDPGGDAPEIIKHLEGRKLEPELALLTHSHFDHVGGLEELLAHYPGLTAAAHPICAKRMPNPMENLSAYMGAQIAAPMPQRMIAHEEEFTVGGAKVTALHLPGHEPGHLMFYLKDDGVLFSGDVLFAGGIGRTDFPGSSARDLAKGIKEIALALPDETQVFPGHGGGTTIGEERRNNFFIRSMLEK